MVPTHTGLSLALNKKGGKMKKFFIVLIMTLLLSMSALAKDQKIVVSTETGTVSAGAVENLTAIGLNGVHGFFSIQITVTGSGTLKAEYEMSNGADGSQVWSTPVGASEIATGLTAGTYLYKFEPAAMARWIRVVLTETGASASAGYTSKIAYQ